MTLVFFGARGVSGGPDRTHHEQQRDETGFLKGEQDLSRAGESTSNAIRMIAFAHFGHIKKSKSTFEHPAHVRVIPLH